MRAGFSMNAPAAARSYGPSKAIAACSVPTARCRAHRFRQSTRARPARLPVARGKHSMASDTVRTSRDWLRNPRINLLAWWLPKGAIVAGLFVAAPARTAIWVIALVWMGTACILNARQCGRTHCRYTGPYYLAMIVPVLVLASGIIAA